MRWAFIPLAATLVISSFSALAQSGARCDAILQHGLWENEFYERDVARDRRAHDWFCHDFRNSGSSSDSSGLFVGIKALGIDFGIPVDSIEQHMTEDKACAEHFASARDREAVTHFWQRASSEIVKAWSSCINSQTLEFRAWIENTYDPGIFRLELRGDSQASNPVTIKTIQVTGAQCKSVDPLPFNNASGNFRLQNQGASAECSRCPTSQAIISSSADHLLNGATNTSSALIVPPAPEPVIGSCQLEIRDEQWLSDGQCIPGAAIPPRNCGSGDCGGGITFYVNVGVPEPRRISDVECPNTRYCGPVSGLKNGCSHVWPQTVVRNSPQSITVPVLYNSHTPEVRFQFHEQRKVSVPRPNEDALLLRPGRSQSVRWPSNAADAKLVCTVSGNTTILDLKRDNTFEQDGLQVSRVSSQETPSDIDNVSQITVQLPSPFASLPACHSSAN